LSETAEPSLTIPRRTCLFQASSFRPKLAAAQATTTLVRAARSLLTATGGPHGRHWMRSAAEPSSISPGASGSQPRDECPAVDQGRAPGGYLAGWAMLSSAAVMARIRTSFSPGAPSRRSCRLSLPSIASPAPSV